MTRWYPGIRRALVSVSIISPRNTAVTEDKRVTIRRRRNWLLSPVTGKHGVPYHCVFLQTGRCQFHWTWFLQAQTRSVSSNTSAGEFGKWVVGVGAMRQSELAQGTLCPQKVSVYPASNAIFITRKLFKNFITWKTTGNFNTFLRFPQILTEWVTNTLVAVDLSIKVVDRV